MLENIAFLFVNYRVIPDYSSMSDSYDVNESVRLSEKKSDGLLIPRAGRTVSRESALSSLNSLRERVLSMMNSEDNEGPSKGRKRRSPRKSAS